VRSITSWWTRLALRAKVAVVAGLPVLALAAAVPVTFMAVRAEERMGDTLEEVFVARSTLALVLQDLADAEASARGYLLTGDARFLQPYRIGAGSARGDLIRLGERLAALSPESRGRFQELSALTDARLENLRRTVTFAELTGEPGLLPEGLLAQGKQTMDQIRAIVDELDGSMARRLASARSDLRRARTTTLMLSVVLGPLLLLGAVTIAFAFANGLVRRVRRIERNAQRLETGEPLDEPDSGGDELARLDRTLRTSAARIVEQDAELRELALFDPLTGLLNRRGFLQIAEHELQVCERRRSPTALLFIDVDGLKLVNDRHGHAAGDRLLRSVAEVLRASTRDSDLLARVGGDEFCVLLTRDSALDGTVLLDRIVTVVDTWNDRTETPYEMAFSIGRAVFDPGEPSSIEDLIDRADRAMYENKRARTRLSSGG
jgi:diguanylate cyclase (GGDEF)-like protein